MRRVSIFVKDNYLSPIVHEIDSAPSLYPVSIDNENNLLVIRTNGTDTASYPISALWCWTEERIPNGS